MWGQTEGFIIDSSPNGKTLHEYEYKYSVESYKVGSVVGKQHFVGGTPKSALGVL
jgi:hypothetical protein